MVSSINFKQMEMGNAIGIDPSSWLCTEEDFAMAGKSVEEEAAASTSAEQPSRSSPFSLRRLPTLAALVFLYFCEAKIPQNGQPISTDWIGTRGPLIYRCQKRSSRRKRHPVNRGMRPPTHS